MAWKARCNLKRLRTVKTGRMALGRRIALALLGFHMDQHRMANPLGVVESADDLLDVMAVHRPQIGDSHILKKHPRNHKLL